MSQESRCSVRSLAEGTFHMVSLQPWCSVLELKVHTHNGSITELSPHSICWEHFLSPLVGEDAPIYPGG